MQIKNFLIYLIPTLVSAIVPIISLPIFTKVLTVEDYGIYALGIVYGTFISGIANFGLTIGYERNYYENEDNQGELLFSVLVFTASTFILFGLLSYIFKSNISLWIIGDQKWGNIIYLSYLAVGLSSLKMYYLTYFKNKKNAKSFSVFSVYETIANFLFSYIFIIILKIGVLGLVLGQLTGAVLVFLSLTFRFLKTLKIQFNLKLLQSCLRISLPLTPRIFFGVIGNQFDKYMINLLGTVGGVGVFNLGQKISYIVFNFISALQNVNSPHVYELMFKKKGHGGEEIGKYLTFPFYISAFIGLLISLFSEELILILTPESFHGAIDIVTILSLLYVLYFFGKQPQLIYAKKTLITSYLTIISIILNIIINIPFIKIWGAEGAAYATLLAGTISSFAAFYYSQKYYKISWEYKKLISSIFTLFLFSFATIILRKIEISYSIRFFIKILFIGSYIIMGLNFHIIKKEHFQKVKFYFKK